MISDIKDKATSRFSLLPLAIWWYLALPLRLQRYSSLLAESWVDNAMVTVGGSFAFVFSLIVLLTGFAVGSLCPHTVANAAFFEIIPLVMGAAFLGAVSSHLGLMLALGYAVGDLFLSTSPLAGQAKGVISPFFIISLPKLLSYMFFLQLAVLPGLCTRKLFKGITFLDSPSLFSAAAKACMKGAIQAFIVYGWAISIPMTARVLWQAAGYGYSPFTVPDYLQVVLPWLPCAAAAGAVLREMAIFYSLPSSAVTGDYANPLFSVSRASWFSKLARPAKIALISVMLLIPLAGMIESKSMAIALFIVVCSIIFVTFSVLPHQGWWREWARLAVRVPLLLRWPVSLLCIYFLFPSVMDPMQNGTYAVFQYELFCSCLGIIITLFFIPEHTVSLYHASLPSFAGSTVIKKQIFPVLLHYLFLGAFCLMAGSAIAQCVEPRCCFIKDAVAVQAAVGISLVAGATLITFLPSLSGSAGSILVSHTVAVALNKYGAGEFATARKNTTPKPGSTTVTDDSTAYSKTVQDAAPDGASEATLLQEDTLPAWNGQLMEPSSDFPGSYWSFTQSGAVQHKKLKPRFFRKRKPKP